MPSDSTTEPRSGCSDAEWEIWYCDTFDRDAPTSVDAKGRGLVQGLMELWARTLVEGVAIGGFSRFWLRWKDGTITIPENRTETARRLRDWVCGEKVDAVSGYVAAAELELLHGIARAHAHLTANEDAAGRIFDAALAASDRDDFRARLESLISDGPRS